MKPIIYARKHENGGPLHDLLMEVCVPDRRGVKSISVLARSLELSAEGVHRWVRNQFVPQNNVKPMVDAYNKWRDKELAQAEILGEELELPVVTLVDFHPYVFKG